MRSTVPYLGVLLFPVVIAGCRDATPAAPRISRTGVSALLVQNDTLPGPGPGPVFRVVNTFEFADLSFPSFPDSQPGGVGTFGFLSVSQQPDSGGGSATMLFYSIVSCDANFFCRAVEEGFGPIPERDFQGGGTSRRRLETNTSADANPDFIRLSGDGGAITLEWQKNSLFFQRSHSTSDTRFGDVRQRSNGHFTTTSATVSGTIIGRVVAGDIGSMGSGRDAFFEFSVAGAVESVSGSGQLTVGGELRTFSFSAVRFADGRVKGQWQRFNRVNDALAHGRVSCFTVIGNRVWLGGPATSTTTAPGETAWRAADNGTSQRAARDQISLQFTGRPPGSADSYCANTPQIPALIDIESGNIEIRR